MANSNRTWRTAISYVAPNVIRIRGYDITELMGRLSFGAGVYLLWTGRLPDENVARLIDAVMIASMDHGATPPSVLAARTVASTGAPLNAAMAAGILSLARYHGAAVADAMRMLEAVVDREKKFGQGWHAAAADYLNELRKRGERAPGLGHRLHTHDPRPEHLFALAGACTISGVYINAMKTLQKVLEEQVGKPMPINIDGAIAAVLCEIGFPEGLANALFVVSRLAGITVHAYEEQQREKPMRKIHPDEFEYDGPPERKL